MPIVSFLLNPSASNGPDASSQCECAARWGARIFCLTIVPILAFLASCKIHFLVLNHSGSGDAEMGSLFQANLEGNDFAQNPLVWFPFSSFILHFLMVGVDIAYGSRTTLKNMGWDGGLLHSHVQTYPAGPNQHVTCYHYTKMKITNSPPYLAGMNPKR